MTSISGLVDNYVRRSFVGKHLASMRHRTPRIYRSMKRVWETLLPLPSSNALARYQARAVNNFVALAAPDLENSTILEVGSDAGAKIIRELAGRGAGRVVGINPGLENDRTGAAHFQGNGLPPNCAFRNDDATNLRFEDETFTHVFSVSVFEHLNNFEQCISEFFRVLKPGGCLYADFGPIWSSSIGHHVYAVVGDEEARHWDPSKNPVPNFAHLLMSREELARRLEGQVSGDLLEAVLAWIYDQPFINRLLFEDYIRVIEASPFVIERLVLDEERLSSRLASRLRTKYPTHSRFDVRNVELILRKDAGGPNEAR